MPILGNDEFLEALSKMSKTVTLSGVVSITFKRYNEDKNCFPSKKVKEADKMKNKCLIRAVTGKKKISTLVDSANVVQFNSSISTILRGSVTYLERKQRKGKKASE